MSRWFKLEISLGSVIQLIVLLTAAISFYTHAAKEVALMRALLDQHTQHLEQHQRLLSSHQDDLVRVKTQLEERHIK